jgi:methylmalonyl-CoA mutase N-terminal domain/subunit
VEKLTSDLEDEAMAYFEKIDGMGGMVAAIERGFPQREIAESAYRFQRAVECKQQVVVGVNEFVSQEGASIGTLYVDDSVGERQLARLDLMRRRRDKARVERALDGLKTNAERGANLMPALIEASRASATVGEMCDGLREVWGEYVEDPII